MGEGMRHQIWLCLAALLAGACAPRGFNAENSQATEQSAESSRAARSRLVGVMTESLGLALETAEKILNLVQDKLLGTDTLDLSRYGGFAYGKQRLLNVGNAWDLDVGLMNLHGDDAFSVNGDYKIHLERMDQRWLNLEIGKRVIMVIPKEHYANPQGLEYVRYYGDVMNFSDKVAIGALQHTDGKKALFIWVFKATSLEQVVASPVTEKVAVTFLKR